MGVPLSLWDSPFSNDLFVYRLVMSLGALSGNLGPSGQLTCICSILPCWPYLQTERKLDFLGLLGLSWGWKARRTAMVISFVWALACLFSGWSLSSSSAWSPLFNSPKCILFHFIQLCLTLCDLMTIAHEVLLSMEFSKQEFWSGVCCHFLLQGIFPTQRSNPHLLCLLH